MSFASDMEDDLNEVFFDDFARKCLLIRAEDSSGVNPVGICCVIQAGIDRFTGGGYVKNKWDVEFKTSSKVRTGDRIQVLNDEGLVVKKYLIGNQADRTGDTVIFDAKVDK